MMGLTLVPPLHALFLFTLMNPSVVLETPLVVLTNKLVVSMAWGMEFLSQQELIQLVMFFRWSCLYQKELSTKVVDS